MNERIPVETEQYYERWQRWFSIRHFPSVDGGATTFFRDITQRKQAEDSLKASEERFRALLIATNDVIYRMNADWTVMMQLNGK